MNPLESLEQNGLATVPYFPDVRRAVEKAVSSWRTFCELPGDSKRRFVYTDEGNLDGAGYELKDKQGATRDLKENFHVTLKALPRLFRTADHVDGREVDDFISYADELIGLLTPMVRAVAEWVGDHFDLPSFMKEVVDGKDNWTLRYLHYLGGRQVGDEIALAHADKSGFTLHLYESDSGLQYLEFGQKIGPGVLGNGSRCWREMPMSKGQMVIIPGMQLQLKTGGRLKALCHRVVATPETATSGRFSMVCFVPLMQTPKFDKSGKGPLQGFAPGFNYEMPVFEFGNLFEK